MNPNLEIRVSVILPSQGKRLAAVVNVAEHIFALLPSERELPWEIQAQEKARMQIRLRREIARDLGEQLAAKILELIEREDPQHGYSPEEWRQINE